MVKHLVLWRIKEMETKCQLKTNFWWYRVIFGNTELIPSNTGVIPVNTEFILSNTEFIPINTEVTFSY